MNEMSVCVCGVLFCKVQTVVTASTARRARRAQSASPPLSASEASALSTPSSKRSPAKSAHAAILTTAAQFEIDNARIARQTARGGRRDGAALTRVTTSFAAHKHTCSMNDISRWPIETYAASVVGAVASATRLSAVSDVVARHDACRRNSVVCTRRRTSRPPSTHKNLPKKLRRRTAVSTSSRSVVAHCATSAPTASALVARLALVADGCIVGSASADDARARCRDALTFGARHVRRRRRALRTSPPARVPSRSPYRRRCCAHASPRRRRRRPSLETTLIEAAASDEQHTVVAATNSQRERQRRRVAHLKKRNISQSAMLTEKRKQKSSTHVVETQLLQQRQVVGDKAGRRRRRQRGAELAHKRSAQAS